MINIRIYIKLMTWFNTNKKLTINPVIGIHIGKTIASLGVGSRCFMRQSARFTIEKIVSMINEVASARDDSWPIRASIKTKVVASAVAMTGVRVLLLRKAKNFGSCPRELKP